MSKTIDEPLRVLRFWRDLEIFNIPGAPSARDSTHQTKITTLRHRECSPLPWLHTDFAPTDKFGYVHVVYLGVADTEDLSRLLLQGLFPENDLSEQERQRVSGNGWLAAFVVNELGHPKSDSYLPASFAHGVAAIRETQALDNINAKLERAKEEFAQRCHQLWGDTERDEGGVQTESHVSIKPSLSWQSLDEELRILRSLLGDAANDPSLDWRLVVRSSRVKRRYLNDSMLAATDFLNSFYLDDLDRLIAQAEKKHPFGSALKAYLGPELPEQQRVDILTNHSVMTELVTTKRLPSARWPASPKHPLVLAQQAAVSHVISSLGVSEGLIGVNGPPGTGKTTLLCDVIAEIITERARQIATLDRPVALFEDKMTVAAKSFYPLKAKVIAGSSIVVTSTNNNAVKNITQELPALKKIAGEYSSADYFADVMTKIFSAQKVIDENKNPIETWGIIAAALGNAGNRRSFAAGFFRDEFLPQQQNRKTPSDKPTTNTNQLDEEPEEPLTANEKPQSMKQLLEAASDPEQYRKYQGEWQKAKQDFLTLQTEFKNYREILFQAENAARSIDEQRVRLDSLLSEERTLDEDIQSCNQVAIEKRDAEVTQRAIVDGTRIVLEQLRSSTPLNLWDRLLNLFGRESRRMIYLRQVLEAPTQALASASAILADITKETANIKSQLRQLQERRKIVSSERVALERKLDTHRRTLHAGYAMGAKHFPDSRFWNLSFEERHRASIAVNPQFDDLRARLFLQAVKLHHLTILANAGKFIANLRAVNGMLTGSSRDKILPEHRPLLWDAFFFVVPVVSTTLASFDRLFIGMGQSSLGWLLIDEAGQATPQSAAGAIWRSRRAVIVGDPLQIEPVFTVPRSLTEELRRHHEVAPHWSPIDESAQTLTDRITPFGSWIQTTRSSSTEDFAEQLWTGMPLRTHRRCDDPMFSVANRIAYADQMVQGRVDESGAPMPRDFSCSLGESAWFDVRSKRMNHPVSEDEIDYLLICLQQIQRERNDRAKIYVISPFRKVAQSCRKRVNDAGIKGVECGTVHTFQGKEAEIVFLVLGTAPDQTGAGARYWAASKPNLLNVAITRAQCRLYVIGDVSQWGKLTYFSELIGTLPKRSPDIDTNGKSQSTKDSISALTADQESISEL